MKDIKNIIETKGNVYLGCYLEEVALFSNPCSNCLQIIWIKHKMDIETKWWLQKLHDNCEIGINHVCKGKTF